MQTLSTGAWQHGRFVFSILDLIPAASLKYALNFWTVSKAFSFEPMFCESVGIGIAAGGGVSGAGYGGEAAEVVLYAFALLMFRGKDVRL